MLAPWNADALGDPEPIARLGGIGTGLQDLSALLLFIYNFSSLEKASTQRSAFIWKDAAFPPQSNLPETKTVNHFSP